MADIHHFLLTKVVLCFLIIISTTTRPVNAGINKDFCEENAPVLEEAPKGPIPDFPSFKDYEAVLEAIDGNDKMVNTGHVVYSNTNQKMSLSLRNIQNTFSLYAFPGADEELSFRIPAGKAGSCKYEQLAGTTLATTFNIHADESGKLILPEFDNMLPATSVERRMYVGQSLRRQIPVDYWYKCIYQAWSDKTVAADIYYSRPDKLMGMRAVPVTLELREIIGETNLTAMKRIDYAAFKDKVSEDDPRFKLPVDMWCENRPDAKNLPTMPSEFKFQAEQTDLGDPTRINPHKPKLYHFEETFNEKSSFTLEADVVSGDGIVRKYRKKTFHDYSTGISYDINVSKGTCSYSAISQGVDAVITPDAVAKMKSPAEFFQLTGRHYQFMGQHKDVDRDIDCDVYTSVETGGTADQPTYTEITWYFASENWMINIMHLRKSFPMPVRMVVEVSSPEPNKKVFDFYSYQTTLDESSLYPDVTVCFPSKTLYLDMLVDIRIDYVGTDRRNFLKAFMKKLMEVSGVKSLARIGTMKMEGLNDRGFLAVRVNLLEKPKNLANTISISEPKNDQTLTNIVNAIKLKKFKFVYSNKFGDYKVNVLQVKPRTVNPTSFEGLHGSKSSSSGYSGGAMGGLAVGMIILGILLGFVVFKVIQRFRNPTATGPGSHSLGTVMG